jgi:hypothetical protein
MSASEDANGTERPRRQFSSEDRTTILRRHLVDHVPVSGLCDEYKIQPDVTPNVGPEIMSVRGLDG